MCKLVNAMHLLKIVMPLCWFHSISFSYACTLSIYLSILFQLHMFSEMVFAFVLCIFWCFGVEKIPSYAVYQNTLSLSPSFFQVASLSFSTFHTLYQIFHIS